MPDREGCEAEGVALAFGAMPCVTGRGTPARLSLFGRQQHVGLVRSACPWTVIEGVPAEGVIIERVQGGVGWGRSPARLVAEWYGRDAVYGLQRLTETELDSELMATVGGIERDVALGAERLLAKPSALHVGAEGAARALLGEDKAEAALAVAREVHGGERLPGKWQALPGAWAQLLVGVAAINIQAPRRPLDDIWRPFHCATVIHAMRRLLSDEGDQGEEQSGDSGGHDGCFGPCCDPQGYEFTVDPIPF